jgi:hypothetical protein
MTERETSTSALTQASFDYNQLAEVVSRKWWKFEKAA